MIKHIHLKECDSTQDILKEQLPDQNQILVSCENQIAGRGRGVNSWLAMPGTLAFSFSLLPHIVTTYTSLEIAVLIALFFEKRNVHLQLKWPNDLYSSVNKKCGGILLQSFQDIMLVGVGLNFHSDNHEFGGIYENEMAFDKKQMALEITSFVNEHRFTNTVELKNTWEKKCFHMNSKVKIVEGSEEYTGNFMGLGEYGEAILESEVGTQKIFNGTLRKLT